MAAADKPFYVSQADPGYGYGCEAHDAGQSSKAMGADGNEDAASDVDTTCSTDGLDAPGEKNDWCLDQWCIVPKGCSGYKLREVSYTADTGDWFSYEVCEGMKGVADPTDAVGGAGEFKGNGWVGRCECEDHDGSFCACPPKYSCSVSGVPTEAHECPCFCEGRGNDRKCQYVDVNGITRNGCASSAAAAAPLAAAVALALFWA